MQFFRKYLTNKPNERIKLTKKNISKWPKFRKLLDENQIKFDTKGCLRYLHGAPVGELILVGVNKDGTPKYKESADEWFDPNSKKAKDFKWE